MLSLAHVLPRGRSSRVGPWARLKRRTCFPCSLLFFAGFAAKDVTACCLVGFCAGCKLLAEDVPWTCPGLKVVD